MAIISSLKIENNKIKKKTMAREGIGKVVELED
jgi:hypothetical protein